MVQIIGWAVIGILAGVGFIGIFGLLYVFVGLQNKFISSKKHEIFGYTITVESTAKKQLKIEIKK
jgi:hypothetical protein